MRSRALAVLFLAAGCGGASSLDAETGREEVGHGAQATSGTLTCTVPNFTGGTGPRTSASWELVQLKPSVYPKALCNDGTSATYMIRRNPNSTKWLIWLDGGGFCTDDVTCAERYRDRGDKDMSSIQNVKEAGTGELQFQEHGVFSVNSSENPTFFDANLVVVPYCSSDLWSGDRAGNPALPVTSVQHWHFRGHAITQAVAKELLLHENLQAAKDVVLTGGSAGAAGLYANVDDFGGLLPGGVRFLGMPDSGFQFDYPSYDPATGKESTAVPTATYVSKSTGIGNWGGRGDASCEAAATTPEAHLLCHEPAHVTSEGHIKTPLLIIENQLDALNSLGVVLVDGHASTEPERAYSRRFATAVRERIAGTNWIHSAFSDYTDNHVRVNSAETGSLKVNTITLRSAIDTWFRKPCTPQRLIAPPTSAIP